MMPDVLFVKRLSVNGRNSYLTREDAYWLGAEIYVNAEAFKKKICQWLEDNAGNYIDCYHDRCELIRDFKKMIK